MRIHPAPLPLAWSGAVLVLAALFGLPALAILFSPARWDALSLASMALGFGIAGWAGWTVRRAWRGRRPQALRLDRAGIALGDARWDWGQLRGLEAVPPAAPATGHGPGASAPGGAAMGQRIGAARVAQEWSVAGLLVGGGRVVLARGLDAENAAWLVACLEDARQATEDGAVA